MCSINLLISRIRERERDGKRDRERKRERERMRGEIGRRGGMGAALDEIGAGST